jgi:hypothetical protein
MLTDEPLIQLAEQLWNAAGDARERSNDFGRIGRVIRRSATGIRQVIQSTYRLGGLLRELRDREFNGWGGPGIAVSDGHRSSLSAQVPQGWRDLLTTDITDSHSEAHDGVTGRVIDR